MDTVELKMTTTLSSPDASQEDSPLRKELETTVKRLDESISRFSDRKRRRCRSQPPVGLEEPFNELFKLLHPCLVGREKNSGRAALIMGMRGSGKTLLVEHTIDSLAAEQYFRVVRLNGLVIRGDDVGFCVKEIIRQLSDIAMMEMTKDNVLSPGREKKMSGLLRLRNSSFTSNLAALDEALRMACIDGMPTLVVLDEFDALLGSGVSPAETNFEKGAKDSQLLLYHLLDRVTSQGTSLCLVAITSHFAAVSMLEKRVKSRTEGTSKVLYIKPTPTYDCLVKILLNKLQGDEISKAVSDIISCSNDAIDRRIQLILERNYKLGKDLRWFCRVVSCALALYREDCQSMLRRQPNAAAKLPTLSQEHFLHALQVMNASFPNESERLVENFAVDPRMQALLDLSGPQVALVLAARRILARDALTEDTTPKPLSLQRMLQEYSNFRGSNRYSDRILTSCFYGLLETDVLRPSADHTGGGPLQYSYTLGHCDFATLSRMPLHLPVDMDRELERALKNDLLSCSTALREWGKKNN
jgi:Cdc6-like AAA superfamily ATPase